MRALLRDLSIFELWADLRHVDGSKGFELRHAEDSSLSRVISKVNKINFKKLSIWSSQFVDGFGEQETKDKEYVCCSFPRSCIFLELYQRFLVSTSSSHRLFVSHFFLFFFFSANHAFLLLIFFLFFLSFSNLSRSFRHGWVKIPEVIKLENPLAYRAFICPRRWILDRTSTSNKCNITCFSFPPDSQSSFWRLRLEEDES